MAGSGAASRVTGMNKNRDASTRNPLLALLLLAGGLGPGRLVAQAPAWVGLSPFKSHLFGETDEFIHGPEPFDRFGSAVAAGDFDGDGSDDLATGIPLNDCTVDGATVANCGSVVIHWSQRGVGVGHLFARLDPTDPASPVEPHAEYLFGSALATGDFDHDGYDDLVIGIPEASTLGYHGAVQVHTGESGSINVTSPRYLREGANGIPGGGTGAGLFGWALAVGDFDGDGIDDLAVGAPNDNISGEIDAGSVVVAHGGATGLLPFRGYRISQDEADVPDSAELRDNFGRALAAGDFNGDGFDDLAIGAPEEDTCGAVLVLFGSPNSLTFADNYWVGESDIGGACETGDRMGAALATGDLNGDSFDDLVFGVPGEDGNFGETDMGMIGILYGISGLPSTGGGLQLVLHQWWWNALFPEAGDGTGDHFGSSLAMADFDRDGFDDLVVGIPGADSVLGDDEFGGIRVLTGNPGLIDTRQRVMDPFDQGWPEYPTQSNARFGSVLAAGDFDGDGHADLAIGAPNLNLTASDDGGDFVIYGSLFSDGFEAWTSNWSAVVP